jgi:hypothetical protein
MPYVPKWGQQERERERRQECEKDEISHSHGAYGRHIIMFRDRYGDNVLRKPMCNWEFIIEWRSRGGGGEGGTKVFAW